MACGWNDERPKILELSGNLRRKSQGEMFAPSYGCFFLSFPERCDRLRCAGDPFESFTIDWGDGYLHERDVELGGYLKYELLRCLLWNVEQSILNGQYHKHELWAIRTPQRGDLLLEDRGQEHVRREYRWVRVELLDDC